MKGKLSIDVILQAVNACFATDEESNRLQRGNRKIEEGILNPIVIGVGLAFCHGFEAKDVIAAFDIEGEDECHRKLKLFSQWTGTAVHNREVGFKAPFDKRLMTKIDLCQTYILQRSLIVVFPIENYI